MTRAISFTILLLTLAVQLAPARGQVAAEEAKTQTVRGVVFHDISENGVLDEGEMPLPGVRVSNGRDVALTDANGQYRLSVDDDTVLFVIKPRGWRTAVSASMLPSFYYVHKPAGSPESQFPGLAPTGMLPDSVDFPLYPQDEPDRFQVILFGDPQARNQIEIDYSARDVIEELAGTPAAFGVTLGDITFDNPSMFEPMTETVAMLGVPWYNVIGNHDFDHAAGLEHNGDAYKRVFGPSYYSFDHGPVHFIVINSVEWSIDKQGKQGYRGGMGTRQLAFIENDLASIPEEQPVVLLMHIPIGKMYDRDRLYRMIEKRPSCISISAHTHTHEHRFIGQEDDSRGAAPHHHIVHGTTSGCWWKGHPDERGIPHATMSDGTPNGYSIMTFDGADYQLDYKAASRDRGYQMQIHAPDAVSSADATKTTVLANVFNGSERSTVEMRVGDVDWTAMNKTYVADPAYRALAEANNNMPQPRPSSHMWAAKLPPGLSPGVHLIAVRTTDMHGRSCTGYRVLRIQPVDAS